MGSESWGMINWASRMNDPASRTINQTSDVSDGDFKF